MTHAVPTFAAPLERPALLDVLRSERGLGPPPWGLIHARVAPVVEGAGWRRRTLAENAIPLAGDELLLWVPQREGARLLRAVARAPRGRAYLEPDGGDRWRLAFSGGREVRFVAEAARVPRQPSAVRIDADRLEALVWLWDRRRHPQEALEELRRMGVEVAPEEVAVAYASLWEEEQEGRLAGRRLARILKRIRDQAGPQTAEGFVQGLRRLRQAREAAAA